MSVRSAKRRKTSAMVPAGAPAIASLPPELLETIFGFMEVRTLCTARLVCTHFHAEASRCIHSVKFSVEDLRSRPETTLNNFPNLSRVSVFGVKEDDLLMLAKSPVADAITHVQAAEYLRQLPRRGRIVASNPFLPLPNLMSLTVSSDRGCAFPFPQTLRELTLDGDVTYRTANLVTRLANLTCLRINVRDMCTPFEAVTTLTALQRLEIFCSMSLIPFVAQLTLLTHLRCNVGRWVSPPDLALTALTRLQRLVHLGVGAVEQAWELQFLASIGTITSLRSLDLGYLPRHGGHAAYEAIRSAPYQLTALRLLSCELDVSLLPRINLERLHDLSLTGMVELDQGLVAALRRATGLTHLYLSGGVIGSSVVPAELGRALLRMPRLRALSLATIAAFPASFCSNAIGPLMELTRLELGRRGGSIGADLANADVEVCLGLKKLRMLSVGVPGRFPRPLADRITPETHFAAAKLPELRTFEITGSYGIFGGDLTDDVRVWLNADRHDKGWPPLELKVRGRF